MIDYNLDHIRAFLTEGFTGEELRRLCYYVPDFRPVYDQLAENTGKAKIIDRLLEHAERKLLFEPLLDWTREHNPNRYPLYQFRHNTPDTPPSSSDAHVKSQETRAENKFLFSVEGGRVTEVERISENLDGVGKIIVKPGSAIVLETETAVSRICGPGVVIMGQDEKIRMVFDLRPQFDVTTLENVITADQISLTMEVGVGYRIQPASNPDDPSVIKESNFGLFPVHKETLLKAAFNGTAAGWTGFGANAPLGALRDQIMTHRLDELFELGGNALDPTHKRVNDQQIKLIEQAVVDTVNGFATDNMGVEITGVDIRQIDLPDEVVEALRMEIKSQAEAEAIQRIEAQRNAARGGLVNEILDGISAGMGSRSMTDSELELVKSLAQISWNEPE